ncbi:MAG: YncE family protein, partial [Planctomycetota bacterium JB042]
TADGTKVEGDPAFPLWLNANVKNRLLAKNALTYVATVGDQDLSTIAAFGGTPGDPETAAIQELRVRLHEVGKVEVNGYWVLKVDDGTGQPTGAPVTIDSIEAKTPVTPAETAGGLEVVESFTRYVVRYTEPVVPESVGISAAQVADHLASSAGSQVPMVFNGNTALSPNPEYVPVPLYPNFTLTGSPNGVASFAIPFDVRPVNPNNLSEYVVKPLVDLPGDLTVTLTSLAISTNVNPTADAAVPMLGTAALSLYDVAFDDASAAASAAFRTSGGRAWTNAPVAPQALYFAPLSGSGAGVVNLDGNGFETNDPDIERIVLCTNAAQMFCPTWLLGCHKNVFGDPSAANPIGLGGNPATLGGPTPVPGVNEGSTGSTANGGSSFGLYPAGFETVVRNSKGKSRLVKSPVVGSVGDIQVGDFLDKRFFDSSNPHLAASRSSFVTGTTLGSNSISDPPVPNPPPLRVPVGLPPLDIVFDQQKLKKPAVVLEGDEVWPASGGRVLMVPSFDGSADRLPTFGQNGPAFQSFSAPTPYATRQQVGNFLYLTDRDQGVVQIVNSNTFTVIDTIETPDPEGLGLSPDLRFLYVSNFGDDSMSVVDSNPLSPTFHQELNRVKVGAGPISVSVQPEHEDVFVTNYHGDSISIFDPTSQSIRKTLKGGLDRPRDVVLTPRHTNTGFFSGVYYGFVLNEGGRNVPIYESGPSGATGIGADSLRWSVVQDAPFAQMRGMTYDPLNPPGSTSNLAGGVFLTHRDDDTGLAMVSRVHWTAQTPGPGQYSPIPLPSSVQNAPGILQRTFEIVGTFGGPLVPLQQKLNFGGQDQIPYDVALSDFDTTSFFSPVPPNTRTNLGASPSAPFGAGGTNSKSPIRFVGGAFPTVFSDRLYVSFPGDDRIEVVDPRASGLRLNSITDVPVVGKLATYFDQ